MSQVFSGRKNTWHVSSLYTHYVLDVFSNGNTSSTDRQDEHQSSSIFKHSICGEGIYDLRPYEV